MSKVFVGNEDLKDMEEKGTVGIMHHRKAFFGHMKDEIDISGCKKIS